MPTSPRFHATTVLGLRHKGKTVIAGDGQVTYGETVLKGSARKIRTLYKDSVLAGFAGTVADAFTLFERFEGKLEEFNGNLARSAVELAKEWRTDRYLRRLEAELAVLNKNSIYLISGIGDVVEPDDNIIAIGSGGAYARVAAHALMKHSNLDAVAIAKEAMKMTANVCIYTNNNISVAELA